MRRGVTRRGAVVGLGAGALAGAFPPIASAQTSARIVIVGGGFGGATAARRLKQLLPGATVTLVEANPDYTACPFSNLVLAGMRSLSDQVFSYDGLIEAGVDLVADTAVDVDAAAKRVSLESGPVLDYDRLILSPGVDIRWGALDGYDQAAADVMPHAWKAGAQTQLLRQQLEAMEDGGVVAISAPAAPYRCPPGPYERASVIARYLLSQKPRSKLLMLDAKDNFSKKPLFLSAWADLYSDVLEWRGASDDGGVVRVDPGAMALETDFERIEADVINVIPPQKAGEIAQRAGVADATGWCPVDAVTFESTLQPGVYVIGDACIAAPMPKSAFAANAQAKVCAIQIARLLIGLPPEPTLLANTCYSFVSDVQAISVAGVYDNTGGVFTEIAGAGGTSPLDPAPGERARETFEAADWFKAATTEAFG